VDFRYPAFPCKTCSFLRDHADLVRDQTVRERLIATLAALLAGVALLLAGIGLYAVLNYSVLSAAARSVSAWRSARRAPAPCAL
jgi:hypothetical protein